MCGFSGIFRWDSVPVNPGWLKKMTGTLAHRGPDDEGYYFSGQTDPEKAKSENGKLRVGLGFRRLSIIDLSGGHQPMTTVDKKNWIVFNGEIYNFPELRKELEQKGCRFLTHSDTEVILHLYEIYGENCVSYLRGMFSFAIWDSSKKIIFLARDRVGKKPLFYMKQGAAFYFASEMKALLQAEETAQNIRREAVPLYLAYQFIPSPITIFEKIQRLPPAHTLTCNEKGEIKLARYWTVTQKPQGTKTAREYSEELFAQLREATKLRLISDVPLGAFLSGGIDSSAVVGMMAQEMNEPVKTFSIGFEESDFSELEYARLISKYFHTDHHELVVKPEMAELLPKLAWHYDQPFADPSALPSYYVARETRKHVTVALNGDGGDENFGGYLRYQADKIFYALSKIPVSARSMFADGIRNLPASWQKSHWARRLARAGTLLGSTPHEFNFKMFCYFDDESQNRILSEEMVKVKSSEKSENFFGSLYAQSGSEEFIDQVLACDLYGYLPDCLLVKIDIATMANSLEARSPFLDHKFMEFAATIPSKYKVKLNGGKWILKESLKNFLPEAVLNRRKMGFGIPLSQWLRNPLKNFLRETLLSAKAKRRDYFKTEEVERLINEHQTAVRDHSYKLWALLMFELWHQVYVDKSYNF